MVTGGCNEFIDIKHEILTPHGYNKNIFLQFFFMLQKLLRETRSLNNNKNK